MAWNATASGGGLAFPLQNLMAAYGPTEPINDWIFQKPGATIDTPTNLTAAQHLAAVGRGRLLPEGRQRDRVHRRQRPLRQGRGRVHVQRRLAERRLRQGPCRATSGSSSSRRLRPAARVAAMSAPLTYGIAANAKNADCAAFFFNWVATNETARQIDVDRRRLEPGRPAGPAGPAGGRRARSPTRRWPPAPTSRKDNGAMDFIANATGLDLRPGLDAGAPEDGRRQAGCCRPPEGRPGRVREGTQPVSHAADEADRGQAIATITEPRRPVGGRRGGSPRSRGIRRQTLVGWLFVLPALVMYGAVRPAAARPDGPVLALPLGRRRPGDLGRARRTTRPS